MDSEIVSGKFSFHIDTGNHPPICCKPPRYVPRESEFMQEIVESLDANGMAEEDNGTWKALVVLAAKPHQEYVPWNEYQWKLRVPNQKMNQVTRPFTLPIPLCDFAVKEIDTEEKYFIAVDIDSSY